jgi:ubiquinone/menaquinone biosynthesis C-methylase UbiE
MLSLMLRLRRLRARTPGIDELIPPERALPSYTRKGDFKKAGARFRQAAVDAGLEPHHRMLDLGCGVGRLAVALSEHLDDRGRYVGLDTDRKAIKACNKWIASKLPQFTFVWADVFNTNYNRNADTKAAQYRFPFDDDAFDFVFSNSLFTHLVPDDAWNYFHEIGRVLKPGGRTVNTIFLLNEESLALVESGESPQGVLQRFGDLARVKRPKSPEAWIALDENFVRQAHDEAGLGIERVRYGAWSGREAPPAGLGKKDVIVAEKLSVAESGGEASPRPESTRIRDRA